ncbi:MAG TPA: bifunctional precorrin-2 dehydrogenase/sirohydrochlorin ferrochelatase [Terriglobales bacterium]|nr:bifunctional precorrin-2 dehydrogenase/sirohydrochlorin ferrochelatase [Terriglobales bacterium]
MSLFPIALKLNDRRCLVVGAGKVGTEKIFGLVDAGALVHVVDPAPSKAVREMAWAGQIELRHGEYRVCDLASVFLAVAATSNADLNRRIFEDALARGILVNVVDVPELCDFYYPATIRRGALTVAVSTEGESPILAQRLRDEISDLLPEEFEEAVARIGSERRRILATYEPGEHRRQLLRDLVYPLRAERFA